MASRFESTTKCALIDKLASGADELAKGREERTMSTSDLTGLVSVFRCAHLRQCCDSGGPEGSGYTKVAERLLALSQCDPGELLS